MKTIFAFVVAVLLSGCASVEYEQYARAQEAVASAKSQSEMARFKAMADIAAAGDSAAKVAAVMALSMGQGSGAASPQIVPPAPNQALQWASILVPGLTQMYGIRANADVAMRGSDNALATSIATTGGFVSLAGRIQAPGAVTTTTMTDRNDSIFTLSGTGTLGGGSYSLTDRHDVSTPAPVVITPTVITPVTPTVPVVITPVFQPAPRPAP